MIAMKIKLWEVRRQACQKHGEDTGNGNERAGAESQ